MVAVGVVSGTVRATTTTTGAAVTGGVADVAEGVVYRVAHGRDGVVCGARYRVDRVVDLGLRVIDRVVDGVAGGTDHVIDGVAPGVHDLVHRAGHVQDRARLCPCHGPEPQGQGHDADREEHSQ